MSKKGLNIKPGRPKSPPSIKTMMSKHIPAADIFNLDEQEMYEGLVGIYLQDFDESQLTANDMDDIISVATNRVLEIRLLKYSKEDRDKQLDASAAIEKLRKQTDKAKENLASRRKDRLDPKKHQGFSIVDLAVSYDMDKKTESYEKIEKLKQEEEDLLKEKASVLLGNRKDADAEVIDEEEE